MNDYRNDLNNYKKYGDTIESLFSFYRNKNILTYTFSENKWSIYFNAMPQSLISFSKFDTIVNTIFPRFFLYDNGNMLNIQEMQLLLVFNLFEKYNILNNGDNIYVVVSKLRKIESELRNTGTYIKDASYNNYIKNNNKVKIIKTFFFNSDDNKIYMKILINAFNVKLEDIDISECTKLFNDPISVELIGYGIHSNIVQGEIDGVGYAADSSTITSIYPNKSNIPERLRQHYTSKYLVPEIPSINMLSSNNKPEEELGGVVVFFETGDDSGPFDVDMLITGEIYATDTIYNKKIKLNRTISFSGTNIKYIKEGSIVHPNDPVIWDMEGRVLCRYTLRYDTATVSDIEFINNTIHIHLEIVDELKVGRVIGETGIKGVIHPVKDLGEIKVNIDGINSFLNVDLLVGPNAIKSGSNGIRLAWLSLKKMLGHCKTEIDTEESINMDTSDIKKVTWSYNGQEYKAYVGYVNFGVTELAKDYKTKEITMSSEAIKYLYNMPNKKYSELAKALQEGYARNNANYVDYLLNILDMNKPICDNIWDIESDSFKEIIDSIDSFFINNTINSLEDITFTSHYNEGISLKIGDLYINFPNYKFVCSI